MSKFMDLRVVKTRRLIRDSLIELIEEKGFDNITINNISERAQINRSTFYLHYVDKYELLNKTIDDALEKLFSLVAPETHIRENKLEYNSFKENIETILETIAEDGCFYKTMLGKNGIINFRQRMESILQQKLGQSFQIQTLIPKELFLQLISSLYMGAIIWWVNNDMSYSSNFMAEQLVKMMTLEPIKIAGLISVED